MDSIKSILVHLDGTARAQGRMRLARQLADIHQASLTALFAVAPRYLPLLPLAGGVPSVPMPAEINPDHRARAVASFEIENKAGASASHWLELSGEPVVETFTRRALCSDLLVLGQRDPADADGFDVPGDLAEAVIVDSGRPAIIIPFAGQALAAPQTVLVAWKATRESARALTAALPFLRQARQVHLVCADGSGDETQAVPVQVSEWLRLHGISHPHEHRQIRDRHAGDDLLSLAAEIGADLIVMGCYGHSRMRELVLGGATLTVLDSMTVPVLMAH
ncbi:universal stress protein [Variovorax sp. PBL-E5]|uniref:universal stress protein n=1 Tax=Variovorax sp. PBL-E5 TaxID=434014 RepID=UPI0013167291|nr:universal stress protein [Variovorax sp. PBL-E5]VTU22119.1 Universal stress protein family protein [Variovorax sp. PBL-E5]